MGKFNKKTASKKVVNKAGAIAYSLDHKTELVHAVVTTFLEDKFYETGDERLNRIIDLVSKVPHDFTAKLAIIARKEFNLRSVAHVLVGELSKIHKGDDLVKNTMVEVCTRPDDVLEIVSYVGSPLPKQIKRGARNAILKYDRYQLAKYKGEGKEISMVDVFNMVHPKVKHANKEQKKAWKDLMVGKLASFDTWEVEISAAKDKKKAWEKLVLEDKLGYMALIRNLNNLIKNDVSVKAIKAAVKKLTDPEEVKKSKQLPFRFLTAYDHVNGNRDFTDAISIAMDHALVNVPKLKGKTLIAIDTSGSMSGDPIEKASIFAAALYKSNDADLVQFSDSCGPMKASSRLPIIDLAQKIQNEAWGGGTNTGSVFESASDKYARIIILSDNQSWNGSAQDAYRVYRKENDCFVFAVDIQGYGSTDLNGEKVKHLTGWSTRLLDFIGVAEKENLVKYIESL